MSLIFHMSHIWNICDLFEKFYVADTIRRWVKPIHKDWNICDFCENFYVVDTIRRQVNPIHKDPKNFICSSCRKSFTLAGNLMKTFMKIKDILNVTLVEYFSLFHHLRVHIKNIHESQKDFKYDSCGWSWYSCMYCLCIFYRIYNASIQKKYTFHKHCKKIWNKSNM